MVWEHFDYYQMNRTIFSSAECDRIIDMRAPVAAVSGLMPGVRDCAIFWLAANNLDWVCNRVFDVARASNYGMSFGELKGAAQLTRYAPGQHYDWHMDLGAGAMSLRKLSVCIELRAAVEGGGLEIFPMGPIGLRPGDAAIFPSFIMHRAAPVIRGERWSLVIWLCGDEPFR
jgi:PKHD-type hydroxylase